jgi:hypothetical protein
MTEVEELIDRTLDSLNDVWTSGGAGDKTYPKSRMQHLFNCIGGTVCTVDSSRNNSHHVGYGPNHQEQCDQLYKNLQ